MLYDRRVRKGYSGSGRGFRMNKDTEVGNTWQVFGFVIPGTLLLKTLAIVLFVEAEGQPS